MILYTYTHTHIHISRERERERERKREKQNMIVTGLRGLWRGKEEHERNDRE
jgi:hypothetical protein